MGINETSYMMGLFPEDREGIGANWNKPFRSKTLVKNCGV